MAATSRTPAIVGFLLAGSALLLISFFANREPSTAAAVPPLHIIAPATGDTIANPFTVQFTTPADLRLTPQGWMADELHVHLIVDGIEHMPAAADITRADTLFTWRLPALAAGEHRAVLSWAARHHGNVGNQTDTVTFVVRP